MTIGVFPTLRAQAAPVRPEWRYFFLAPLVFSVLVALGLVLAAWRGLDS
jgi:hypothetical protein